MVSHKSRRRRRRPLYSALVLISIASLPSLAAAASGPSLLNPRQLLSAGARTYFNPKYASRNAVAATASSFNASTTGSIEVVTDPERAEGRYGHSAVYIEERDLIYFIGGQLRGNTSATRITNQVLSMNLSSLFVWDTSSDHADNPSAISALSKGLPATAWASSAVDGEGLIWLLGGVSEDCSRDSTAHILDAQSKSKSRRRWSVPKLKPRSAPRRRQASAVAVRNSTTGGSDFYVLGGIAEKDTCSEGTVGYRGVDRYDTRSREVESFGWEAPLAESSGQGFEPPLSDYTATLLADGKTIAVVGGQAASGEIASMERVLLLDVETRRWTSQHTTGLKPQRRMGHVAVQLRSGSILIHGGLGVDHEDGDDMALNDVLLLTPSADTSAPWTWSKPAFSDSSLDSPHRAWHTATLTTDDTIIVAFGIDTVQGEPANVFRFLDMEEDGLYIWRDTPKIRQEVSIGKIRTVDPVKIAAAAAVIVPNPKANSVEPEEPIPTWSEPAWTPPTPSAPVATEIIPSVQRPSGSSTAIAATSPADAQAAQEAVAQKRTTIGATLGSLAGLVALVGVGAVILRRRRSRKDRNEPDTPKSMSQVPFVSTLMYTRPVQQRMLSLGSTVSAPGSIADSELEDTPSDGDLAAARDPFGDEYMVNEVGELRHERRNSDEGSLQPPPGLGVASTFLAAISPSIASVASIPYLSALTRFESPTSPDPYTSQPPTLASRRSQIRSPQLSAPTQEFGVALSVGETPRPPQPTFVDYVKQSRPSTPERGGYSSADVYAAERAPERTASPAGSTTANVGRQSSAPSTPRRLPTMTRPRTPLRVTNPELD